MHQKEKKRLEHWQIMALLLGLCDFISIHFSYFLALLLRFDGVYSRIPRIYLQPYRGFILYYAIGAIILFHFFRMYRGIWRFAGLDELVKAVCGSLTASVLHAILINLIFRRMPISYHVIGSVLQLGFVVVPRFAYRLLLFFRPKKNVIPDDEITGRVMVVGAGSAGHMIIRDIKNSELLHDKAVCIIDDNPNKWGRYIEGIPVVGGRESILDNVARYQVTKIYVAMASATAEQRRDILNICKEAGCELKVLPSLYQVVRGDVTVSSMKEVSIEDLLGREEIAPEMKEVFDFISGKVVLVTGGGGSIGSELCRQVANHGARQLIIFDIYENNAYDIQNELKRVASIVNTYHPMNPEITVVKDAKYVALTEEMEKTTTAN